MDDQFKATALAGLIISSQTVATLYRKGIITKEDAFEIFDMSLLNLEQHQAVAGDDQTVVALAREMVDSLMKGL